MTERRPAEGCKSDRAYQCTTHDTQWLDDESDRCEYKRMVDAEAAIARVRDVCDLWQRRHDTSIRHPTAIPAIPITAVLRALDGTG